MSDIEWTDQTWNPIVGCSKASTGCEHCYAMGDSPHRFAAKYEREGVVKLRGRATREGLTYVPKKRVPASERKGRQVLERHEDGTITVSLGKGAQWTGEVRLLPWMLDKPLRRRKPTTYFVNSIADTFHPSVVDSEEGRRYLAAMWGVMAACPQHTFQVLTKRPHKAREWFAWLQRQALTRRPVTDDGLDAPDGSIVNGWERVADEWHPRHPHECMVIQEIVDDDSVNGTAPLELQDGEPAPTWPLPNVWIGTSVEDQTRADERIPHLLEVPAAMRFLSCEPLLGLLDLSEWLVSRKRFATDQGFLQTVTRPGCDWVITGGESGAKARPCEVAWIRSIVEQCQAAGVPVFVKQLGAKPVARDEMDMGEEAARDWDAQTGGHMPAEGWVPRLRSKKGADMAEWPEDLCVRVMPEVDR